MKDVIVTSTALPGPAPMAQRPMRLELQDRMEEFLELDLFTLVIQPVMDFRKNTTQNGEVLSRLEHPERGVIFPDQFLAAIDAMGLYPRFDRYIFRKSCAWLSRSLAAGERMDCISCNFSRKTLSEAGLAQDLIQIADHYGLPHNMLGLEIMEREKETDAGQMLENLKRLKESGFRIILDDYGKGIASADDLMRYPLDIVKIDSSLLLDACTEQGMAALRELIAAAKRLGAEVVCEGIETKEQDAVVREAGCDYGQGYLYFKPIRQDDVFEMMKRSSILEDEE